MEGVYVKALRACIALSLAGLIAGLALKQLGVDLLHWALWLVVASPYVALALLPLDRRYRRLAPQVAVILLLAALDLLLTMSGV